MGSGGVRICIVEGGDRDALPTLTLNKLARLCQTGVPLRHVVLPSVVCVLCVCHFMCKGAILFVLCVSFHVHGCYPASYPPLWAPKPLSPSLRWSPFPPPPPFSQVAWSNEKVSEWAVSMHGNTCALRVSGMGHKGV